MKTVLFIFLLLTAVAILGVATLAFLGIVKARKDKGKTDDDMAIGVAAAFFAWIVGGVFLYLAYLAS